MTALPPLAISQLTAIELDPPRMLRAAAACGCQAAGVRMIPVVEDGPAYPLMHDKPLLRETKIVLAATGMTISDLEIVMLRPETRIADYAAFLEAGAEIGARHVVAAAYDPEPTRLVERFGALCDLARPFGLTADLEFMPWSEVPDLATALRIVGAAARPNAGVLFDALHFARSGADMAALGAAPREWFHYWQICDAEAAHPGTIEGLLHTARAERLFPGEGELDLLGMAAALPRDLTVSIEVPKASLAQTVSAPERIRMAVDATRALLARLPDAA